VRDWLFWPSDLHLTCRMDPFIDLVYMEGRPGCVRDVQPILLLHNNAETVGPIKTRVNLYTVKH